MRRRQGRAARRDSPIEKCSPSSTSSHESGRVHPAVRRSTFTQLAFEHRDCLDWYGRGEVYPFRQAHESACAFSLQPLSHAPQRDVRAKRASIDLEAHSFTRDFHVMMQQLEPWLLLSPEPEHTCPPKTGECAEPASF